MARNRFTPPPGRGAPPPHPSNPYGGRPAVQLGSMVPSNPGPGEPLDGRTPRAPMATAHLNVGHSSERMNYAADRAKPQIEQDREAMTTGHYLGPGGSGHPSNALAAAGGVATYAATKTGSHGHELGGYRQISPVDASQPSLGDFSQFGQSPSLVPPSGGSSSQPASLDTRGDTADQAQR